MKFKNKTIAVIITALLILVACKSALTVSTNQKIDKNVSQTNLPLGKELYANKCAKCHKLFEPDKFSKTEWTKWVDRMAPKAKLTPEEKEMILALNNGQ